MTMNSSGPISLAGTTAGVSIEIENGGNGTTQISLNDTAVRSLAGVPSGAITMPTNFYGKANQFSFTISTNQTDANLRSLAVTAGWNQASLVVATVNSGVYVYATSTANAGLTINGSFPGGVQLINNGYILGKGGGDSTTSGNAGGPAISLGVNATITNNSGAYIAGGGGQGGGQLWGPAGGGGGGAGGGNGGPIGGAGGGSGGGPGASGTAGGGSSTPMGKSTYSYAAGGGGGRILPGSGGGGGSKTNNSGQGGGAGGGGGGGNANGGPAGGGGSANGSGGGSSSSYFAGGGGGWGASGGNSPNYGGGAGGKAIALNGFTATQSGAGTTYGTVA